MLTASEFNYIRKKIFSLLSFEWNGEFEIKEYDGVFVSFDGEKAVIGGEIKANISRGLMLFVKNIREGKKSFEITEKKRFKRLGLSLDLSRGASMRPEKIMEYADILASLGFDSLMVYLEDMLELPGYPHFGYRSGRYTVSEIKKIDAHCLKMGIELVPSVQTLGHLEKYLRWKEAAPIRDTASILLCGEDKTYEFIDVLLKTVSEAFTTRYLSVGCDEPHGLGTGVYLSENGLRDGYDIAREHLTKVFEITEKYGLKPILCGDLYLRHFNPVNNGYYNFNIKVNPEECKDIPKADVMYWDYFHTDKSDYEFFLNAHKDLGNPVIFFGGVWTWCGFLPNLSHTEKSMLPALEVMLENGVTDVWAATFGDDGTETDLFFAVPGLPLFSEFCFKGKEFDFKDMSKTVELICGASYEEFKALSEFHFPFIDKLDKSQYHLPNYMGKKLFYTDLLHNFTNTYDFDEIRKHNIKGYEAIKTSGKGAKSELAFDFARVLFEIIIEKSRLLQKIREAYDKKDKKTLLKITGEFSALVEKYDKAHSFAEKMWRSTNRMFGWDELNGRYATVTASVKYAERVIRAYCAGELETIEEMDYEFIEDYHGKAMDCGGVGFYRHLTSATY